MCLLSLETREEGSRDGILGLWVQISVSSEISWDLSTRDCTAAGGHSTYSKYCIDEDRRW